MIRSRLVAMTILATLAGLLAGCTHTRGPVRPDGMSIHNGPDPLLGLDAYTGDDVLRIAGEAFELALYPKAYAVYMRYVDEFPGTYREGFAWYNAGLSAERSGMYDQAIEAYERFVELSNEERERVAARFRLVSCMVASGRWEAASEHIDKLLARPDTVAVDRFELKVQRAWIQANTGDPAVAQEALHKMTRRYRHDRGRTYGGFQGAMANYYLGETCRLRAEAVQVLSVDDLDSARAELNTKAQHILDAQEAYLETIRIGVHVWIPRAGYGLGSLYTTFRRDILSAPYPAVVHSDEDREIYAEILDDETAGLLFKTRMVYEKVLDKAGEVSINDEAVAMIRESLARVEQEIVDHDLAVEI